MTVLLHRLELPAPRSNTGLASASSASASPPPEEASRGPTHRPLSVGLAGGIRPAAAGVALAAAGIGSVQVAWSAIAKRWRPARFAW